MHCTNCGTLLPQGATNCPVCGTPTSIASSPQNPPAYDPTVVAQQPYGTPQPTDYGTPSYGTPPQGAAPSNPYQQPVQDAYGNYGVPAQPNAYGQPSQPNYGYPPPQAQPSQPNYGYPPPQAQPAQPNYGYPPAQGQPVQPNYGYPQGQPQAGYVPPVPGAYGAVPAVPKKRSNVGLIIGIVLGVVLLICVGAGVLVGVLANQAGKTLTATATKAASSTGAPSGKAIVPSAAAILSNPQTSSDVDSNYNPTHVTSTFTTNQSVYLTFNIDSGSQDGYIEAKWYADGQLVNDRSFTHTHTHDLGIFSHNYTTATNNGAAELYWCTQSNCSDAQLAQVVHFTVTSSSLVPSGPTVALIQDADRRLS